MCCSVLQCVAVCCSVVQCVAVLQYVAVCCSALLCTAVCCSVVALCRREKKTLSSLVRLHDWLVFRMQRVAVCCSCSCSALQCVAEKATSKLCAHLLLARILFSMCCSLLHFFVVCHCTLLCLAVALAMRCSVDEEARHLQIYFWVCMNAVCGMRETYMNIMYVWCISIQVIQCLI